MSQFKPLFIRLHLIYHYPEYAPYIFGNRATIIKKLVQINLKDIQSEWNPEYSKLRPLSMFRKALNISQSKYLDNKYLYHIVRYLEPKTVIETGVHYGISTAFILKALHDNDKGTLISIDLPNKAYKTDLQIIDQKLPKGRETGFLIPEELKDRWILQIGDAREYLEDYCRKNAPIDLFHHDSEHTFKQMMWEFQTVWPYINKNGLIASDDADWNEAVATFGTEKMLGKNGLFAIYQNRGCILKK